jgi:hypothetical protein
MQRLPTISLWRYHPLSASVFDELLTFLPELEAITRNDGHPHLLALRTLGSTLSLSELIRIAEGEQHLPSV